MNTKKPKQEVAFAVSEDIKRIMGTPADPNGFNPEVNKPITDASARSYASQVAERMQAKKSAAVLKGKAAPLGGAPPINREKAEAIANLNMAQPSFQDEPPSQDQQEPQQPPQKQQPVGGVGAAYPVNHALSQGQTDGPVTLKEGNKMTGAGKPPLSQGSIDALKMAAQNVKKSPPPAPPQPQQEEAQQEIPLVSKQVREELDELDDQLSPNLPDVDFGAIKDLREALMAPERRKAIEDRLEELDLADMILKREVSQTVPVIPGKFELHLRTISQSENLWILKYIYDFSGSLLYTQELLNTCRMVCALVGINRALLPDHRKDIGKATEDVDKESFEKKFRHVVGFPVQLIADMSVQIMWFQNRVERLFTMDALKNG